MLIYFQLRGTASLLQKPDTGRTPLVSTKLPGSRGHWGREYKLHSQGVFPVNQTVLHHCHFKRGSNVPVPFLPSLLNGSFQDGFLERHGHLAEWVWDQVGEASEEREG